jgi:VanZ family protein
MPDFIRNLLAADRIGDGSECDRAALGYSILTLPTPQSFFQLSGSIEVISTISGGVFTMLGPRLATLLRQATLLALAVYWIALFVGTHMPVPRGINLENSDKWIHFFAYAGLGGLMTLAAGWRSQAGLRLWHLALIAVSLAAFGGFDELTQPLAGRDADWLDWFADVGGVIAGTTLGALAVRLIGIGQAVLNGECEMENGE